MTDIDVGLAAVSLCDAPATDRERRATRAFTPGMNASQHCSGVQPQSGRLCCSMYWRTIANGASGVRVCPRGVAKKFL
jgi:hypothetical protein